MSLAPRYIASAISSPVPLLLARRGSSSSGFIRVSPLAAALSMTAVCPARPYEASIMRPSGSWTRAMTTSPPSASVSTIAKPSPPSETGSMTQSCPARPSATAAAASAEPRQPLNESMAMTAFIWTGVLSWLVCGRFSGLRDRDCRPRTARSIPGQGPRDTVPGLRIHRKPS